MRKLHRDLERTVYAQIKAKVSGEVHDCVWYYLCFDFPYVKYKITLSVEEAIRNAVYKEVVKNTIYEENAQN